MIISASRRTDIPAFYSEWFISRIREGFCTTVNPFNSKQVATVSLRPEDVDVIVFWTKNPSPLLARLDVLDEREIPYYFQLTINDYPREFEPRIPSLDKLLNSVGELSDRIGPKRIVWRYDPIILSSITGIAYHMRKFEELAEKLSGKTKRVTISLVDSYRKAEHNLRSLIRHGIEVRSNVSLEDPDIPELLRHMASVARHYGLEITSCAEDTRSQALGIRAGKCIDDRLIFDTFGLKVSGHKDRSQRPKCGCIPSKDIGFYDTCLHGCTYCYASNLKTARNNRDNHFPDSPSLLGRYESEGA